MNISENLTGGPKEILVVAGSRFWADATTSLGLTLAVISWLKCTYRSESK